MVVRNVQLPIQTTGVASSAASEAVLTPTSSPSSAAGEWDSNGVKLDVLPLRSRDGMLLTVRPPLEPPTGAFKHHVPCDIVLVIDVSGSMSVAAPAPIDPGSVAEETGLSVLDLVKHAALTIEATLDEGDRLGIVAFSRQIFTLQGLTKMDEAGKTQTKENINSMTPMSSTNMWGGITAGLDLLANRGDSGRVPALMVLTDGVPNYNNPPPGWIPALKKLARDGKGKLAAPIHTFGFGYQLKSGILKSISEFSGGDYAFIPDALMIGTVFIHAIANIQATFAQDASITIAYPRELRLETTMGDSLHQNLPAEDSPKEAASERQGDDMMELDSDTAKLTIQLGNVQYGQSKDVFLRYQLGNSHPQSVTARLDFRGLKDEQYRVSTQRNLNDFANLPAAEVAYHISRSMICDFLSSLFPVVGRQEEHRAVTWDEVEGAAQRRLAALKEAIPAHKFPGDPDNQSLLSDLEGREPEGQISLAIEKKEYWTRWGQHYLPSILNAHARQVCNSFKDEGPLRYGDDSPLFKRCRDRLNDAFDQIPPPNPTSEVVDVARPGPGGGAYATRYSAPPPPYSNRMLSMATSYNSRDNPCFAGSTMVLLAGGSGAGQRHGGDGRKEMPSAVRIGSLRSGMQVQTPLGPRTVAAVLKTRVRRQPMRRLGDVLVTPWHPVRPGNGGKWAFPAETAGARRVHYTGSIYSVLLRRDPNPDAHAIAVGGAGSMMWGVTLGHGLVGRRRGQAAGGDVRVHDFFGSYRRVVVAISRLGIGRGGVLLCGGLKRSRRSGKVVGLRRPRREDVDSRRPPTSGRRRPTTVFVLRKDTTPR